MLNLEQYTDGKKLFDGQYKLLYRLSEAGGTADVWLALAVKTIDVINDSYDDNNVNDIEDSGIKVAIKIYKLQNILDIEGEQRFKDEFKIVYDCRHANLLPPSHFSIFEDTPYLVMPFCQEGSSEKLIGKIDNNILWKYILDVSSGLAYLHSCTPPIIHQDIKPANILMDSNHNYVITDFGISTKKISSNNYFDDANSGTLIYMAPERFRSNPEPMQESDIWAFGATLFEIVTGDVPFGNEGGLAQKEGASIPPIKQDIPIDIKKLIYACLDKDPEKRPTAQEIIDSINSRETKRNRIKKSIIIATLFLLSIVIISTLFSRTNTRPFDDLCNSGDSIVVTLKQNIKNKSFKINDVSKAQLVQAQAFYGKAITMKSKDSERTKMIDARIYQLDYIMMLYTRYKEVSDTISMTIDLDMPEQNEIFERKKEDITKIITNKITEL